MRLSNCVKLTSYSHVASSFRAYLPFHKEVNIMIHVELHSPINLLVSNYVLGIYGIKEATEC